MDELSFHDFDIRIQRTDTGYQALVGPPDGPLAIEFRQPFSSLELQQFEAGPAAWSGGLLRDASRPSRPPVDLSELKQWGDRLFKATFPDEAARLLEKNLPDSRSATDALRIRLRLDQVPELARLPWEYLYDSFHQPEFITQSDRISMVRWTDRVDPVSPLRVDSPLRLLVLAASPPQFPPLAVQTECDRLHQAVEDLEQRGLLEWTLLQEATLEELNGALNEQRPHVLHFVGHGSFGGDPPEGRLLLGGRADQPWTDGNQLGALLRGAHAPRLVFLNACLSAQGALQDPFAGVAQGLARQGVPGVVAMRFVITDAAAIILAAAFYESLAREGRLDTALVKARCTLLAVRNGTEWGTPVLYLRATDGRIFDVQAPSPSEQRGHQLAALCRAAEAAMVGKDWEPAHGYWKKAVALQPELVEAREGLQRVEQEIEAQTLYRSAAAQIDSGDWSAAETTLQRLLDLVPSYRDAWILLIRARTQLQNAAVAPASAVPAKGASEPPPGAMSLDGPALEDHYKELIRAILTGGLVIFLGPDIGINERSAELTWRPGQDGCLPNSDELAEYLAEWCRYPWTDRQDLVRVAQFAETDRGLYALQGQLRDVFQHNALTTSVHQFLVGLPQLLREKGYVAQYPLLITATYDTLLERAFRLANEPFDLVAYVGSDVADEVGGGPTQCNRFWHWPTGSTDPRVIDIPNDYNELPLRQRPVILKMHAAQDQASSAWNSYVITEDQYIHYSTAIQSALPTKIRVLLNSSRFLFLGYRLTYWHLRVFLYKMWTERINRKYRSWVVGSSAEDAAQQYWSSRFVDSLPLSVDQFLVGLQERLQTVPTRSQI